MEKVIQYRILNHKNKFNQERYLASTRKENFSTEDMLHDFYIAFY